MLPYNTIALDEQSHWDQLAAMMPYSDRDVVLSKYLVGWGGCLAVGALALAAGAVERPFFTAPAAPQAVLAILCTGLIMVAVSMPVLFRFGVAKGRFMILIMAMLVCGCAGAASGSPAARCCWPPRSLRPQISSPSPSPPECTEKNGRDNP